jgi:hypothetical protein
VPEQTYSIAEVLNITGLPRPTLDRYIKAYRIKCESKRLGGVPRNPRIARRLPMTSVRQIQLIAALTQDVLFHEPEIKSVLKRMDVDRFTKFFGRCSFPRLLKNLKKSRVKINSTPYLDRLLRKKI